MENKLRIAIPLPSDVVYANYFNALEALGVEGVKIAADADPADFDGLLLPGGADVDPARYNRPNTAAVDIEPELDELQLSALDRFAKADRPVFGICRGHQLLNVYLGGTLIQNLPSCDIHRWTEDGDRVHFTLAEPGSWIESLYGTRFPTNSAHHQAVETPGRGMIVDQRSEDGVIEATHHESLPLFSVQWHPERMCFAKKRDDTVDGSVVIKWFLDFCATRR